jgi:arylsulfatase A-like enzyme
VDLPPHRARDLDRRPWWHRASLEGKPQIRADLAELREKFSRLPELPDEQLREVIANYYGMISLIDHNVGRMLIELCRLGLDENTIVIYSADHGDWLGDHGLLLKGPMTYEGLLRVGCIVRGPGVPAGKVVAEPVSTIDLAATMLDYASATPLMPMHSRSLRPLIEREDAHRDFAFSEWDLRPSRTGVELQLRTVRTRSHKLTVDVISGAGELYDLENDPDEMINLFEDPAAKDIRGELEAMLASRPDDARPELLPQVGMA